MTPFEKKKLLTGNSILWVIAMLIPAGFDLAFKAFASETAKFPWPMIIPLLFVGLLLASNKMLSTAIGETQDEPTKKPAA